ncbi:uroporphyrinogen-III synthase [Dietzia kunjamensis]|uniref:uroporphyrinogen-III synthase n=1 Tax=Dietzia kunjamensis TaxID=322509 RepID=UPI00388FB070
MTRARTTRPGTVRFVGGGPGNAGMLTCRAQEVLTGNPLVFADADVSADVLALVATEVPVPQELLDARRAEMDAAVAAEDKAEIKRLKALPAPTAADVRPVLGEPAAVAKQLVAEAKKGRDVVRLVTGDPMTTDATVTEIAAVGRTVVPFEVVPGVAEATAVPAFAGIALGSGYVFADGRGKVDWAALVGSPGPIVLRTTGRHLAEAASSLAEQGLAAGTPVTVTCSGSLCAQKSADGTLATMAEVGRDMDGDLVVTIGKSAGERHRHQWWESRAMFGWNVLVPRTKAQSAEMSDRIAEHGAVPVEVPTIAVEPPRSPAQMERAVKGLVDGRYQWVVFTSSNAVRAVWEKFVEFGLDARAFSGVKIACVGEGTAARVRELGIQPELLPSGEQSSLGLLEVFPPYDDVLDPVNRVLLPRADIATETLAEGLTGRGWEIEDVTAYRTVRAAPPAAEIREMIKTGGFDAVCFTSSSTVRNLVGIAGKPHARTLIACIGPRTAETAAEFGLRVDVQPENASVIDLVDALAAHADHLRAAGELPPPRRRARRR